MSKYAVVVGKFLPFHKGHELVINEALKAYDRVIVITYTSNEHKYNHLLRKTWIETVCPGVEEVLAFPPSNVPDDDASEVEHRKFCAKKLHEHIKGVPSVVYGSEHYISGFADFLSGYFDTMVEDYLVDQERTIVPISGTKLRETPELMKEFCHKFVYTKRVAILGGESTGKTTAVTMLNCFGYSVVYEYGRDWWSPAEGRDKLNDLVHIANTQVSREYEAVMLDRVDSNN